MQEWERPSLNGKFIQNSIQNSKKVYWNTFIYSSDISSDCTILKIATRWMKLYQIRHCINTCINESRQNPGSSHDPYYAAWFNHIFYLLCDVGLALKEATTSASKIWVHLELHWMFFKTLQTVKKHSQSELSRMLFHWMLFVLYIIYIGHRYYWAKG